MPIRFFFKNEKTKDEIGNSWIQTTEVHENNTPYITPPTYMGHPLYRGFPL